MSKLDKIEELQNLLKENPQDFHLRRELAVLLMDCGFNEEAMQQLKYISKNFQDDEGIYYNIGIIYEKMKDYEKAKENYRKSIKIKPDFIDAIYNLGLVYTELNEFNEAIECFNKTIAHDELDSNSYFNLALVYFKQKDFLNAIQNFQKTIDINDEDLYAHFYLGNIYKELGDPSSAKYEFEKVIEISPDYSWAFYNIAVIYYEQGDINQAIDYLLKTIDKNPNDYEAYIVLTKIYLKIKQYENAKHAIEMVISLKNPITGNDYYLAAMTYKHLDNDSYISYLSKSIKNYHTMSIPVEKVKKELSRAKENNI